MIAIVDSFSVVYYSGGPLIQKGRRHRGLLQLLVIVRQGVETSWKGRKLGHQALATKEDDRDGGEVRIFWHVELVLHEGKSGSSVEGNVRLRALVRKEDELRNVPALFGGHHRCELELRGRYTRRVASAASRSRTPLRWRLLRRVLLRLLRLLCLLQDLLHFTFSVTDGVGPRVRWFRCALLEVRTVDVDAGAATIGTRRSHRTRPFKIRLTRLTEKRALSWGGEGLQWGGSVLLLLLLSIAYVAEELTMRFAFSGGGTGGEGGAATPSTALPPTPGKKDRSS